MFYFSLAETNFRKYYNNHKRDAKHVKYQYNTKLKKNIWKIKSNNIKYNIQWKDVVQIYGNANSALY